MKVNCAIILGPFHEPNNFLGIDSLKFTLPFLNTPLLNISINYLIPHASKIFILCLSNHSDIVRKHIISYKIPIEIITTDKFEGMSYIFSVLSSKLESQYFILCKGDIYGLEPLKPLLESFLSYNADMYLSLSKTQEEGDLLCLDSMNYLRMYNVDECPFIKNEKMFLTTNYYIKDFYIIKTSIIKNIPEIFKQFKKDIIPYFIKINKKIKSMEDNIFQIKSEKQYMLQLSFKNTMIDISNGSKYNMIDSNCNIGEDVCIEDSIIGENCLLGYKSIIKHSIIMDNCIIEPYSVIESCIIGRNSRIKSKSKLKD